MKHVWNDLAHPPLHLMQPWSPELAAAMPHPTPYLTVYERQGKQLIYVAAHHGPGIESPTMQTVRHAFEQYRPQIALIEGIENNGTRSPSSFVHAGTPMDFVTSSESAYTAHLALRSGIDFISAEPTDALHHQAYRNAGYSDQDFLCFEAACCLRSMARGRRLPPGQEALHATSEKLLTRLAERYAVPHVTTEQFSQWFSSKNNSPFDHNSLRALDLTPRTDPAASYFHRASAAEDSTRDAAIVQNIAEALQEHDRVLTVFGNAHLAKQDPVFKAIFQKTVRHYKPY